MIDFAGWCLPVQFQGTLAEHHAARTGAALFDVSHMGQVELRGQHAARALETLVPADILGLAPGRQRYTVLLNEAGGILDDLMVANLGDRLFLVLNAARAEADLAHLRARLGGVDIRFLENRALIAVQGPRAASIMARHAAAVAALPFLGAADLTIAGIPCVISRSGYTGEDGFEISVPANAAEMLADTLLAEAEIVPAGLAARDTLRLEAGLCLYGSDIDELSSPVEAGLGWSIARRRRESLDFPGAAVIHDHFTHGTSRLRVGIRPRGRIIARAGCEIAAADGTRAGIVTSGGFAPSLGTPIAMGYVRRDLATPGTELGLLIRGQCHPAIVAALPFVPHRFAR
jgi:aminomethyltransferase